MSRTSPKAVDTLIAEVAHIEPASRREVLAALRPTMTQAADEQLLFALAMLGEELHVPPAEAGRELLRALARWFGIDFPREAEAVVDPE